jgi:hypothetical protein
VEARLCAAALLKLRQGRTKEIANGLLAASAENPHLLDPVREVIKATLENLKATSDDLDAAREHEEVWGRLVTGWLHNVSSPTKQSCETPSFAETHPSEPKTPDPSPTPKILQFKVWLIGLSPMIWRRVQVPDSMMLRELHGVIQLAMGWEGIHLFQFTLRARRFGSLELAARSPDVALSELRLRQGARFRYEYDLNRPWEHEVRLESRHEADRGTIYPICLDGDGSCPPEDCGGVNGFLARREAWTMPEVSCDLMALADFVDQLALKRSTGGPIDAEEVDEIREALERLEVRHGWQGKPFSRKDVNTRLSKAEYLNLMHQQ